MERTSFSVGISKENASEAQKKNWKPVCMLQPLTCVDLLIFSALNWVLKCVSKKRCHFLPWESMMDTFHHFTTYFRGHVWIHNSSSSNKFSLSIHFKETSASVQRDYWHRWLKKAQLFRASRCFVEWNVCFYRKSFHYLRNHCTINIFLSFKNPSDLI